VGAWRSSLRTSLRQLRLKVRKTAVFVSPWAR
jgi:hypothetical protein